MNFHNSLKFECKEMKQEERQLHLLRANSGVAATMFCIDAYMQRLVLNRGCGHI